MFLPNSIEKFNTNFSTQERTLSQYENAENAFADIVKYKGNSFIPFSQTSSSDC